MATHQGQHRPTGDAGASVDKPLATKMAGMRIPLPAILIAAVLLVVIGFIVFAHPFATQIYTDGTPLHT